jgi:hypothetical protein
VTTADSGYPHDLAGDPAPPPAAPAARVLGMALKAHARHLAALDEPDGVFGAAAWRLAGAVEQLRAEADQHAPGRNRASDGTIGDARHMEAGSGSDHNPWITAGGVGVVRAIDLTNDPALALHDVFERLRARVAAGGLPQLAGGGYLILGGRITADDWTGWKAYRGADPHVSHGHVSVSRSPAGFDSRAEWGAFRTEQPAPPAPAPAPRVEPVGWSGPDLTGTGAGLRGQAAGQPSGPQSNGPRVAALQAFLNRAYPAYSDLAVDGWYGEATAGVLRQFAARSGIDAADGLNIGPKLAAALSKAGFERTVSAARARVLGHVGRRTRR